MSSIRSFLKSYNIIVDGDMSGQLISEVTDIRTKDQICLVITSQNTSAAGQWYVDASIDQVVWVPMEFSPAILPTVNGSNDAIMIDMKLLSFTYIRARWEGSGVGVANVTISAKGN